MNHFKETHKFKIDLKNENHSGNIVSGESGWLSLKDTSWIQLF